MNKIKVGFSKNNSVLSRLIRFMTRAEASHAYILIDIPEYKENMVFQASLFWVGYCNYRIFKKHSTIVRTYDIPVSDEQWEIAERMRVQEAGKPYSVLQLLGFLAVLPFRKIGINISNPFADGDHSYVCVEIVAGCLGIKGAESMTPDDLMKWCSKHGKPILR